MPKEVKMSKGREFVFKTAKGGAMSRYDWAGWFATDEKGQGKLLLLEQSAGEKNDKGDVVKVTAKKDYDIHTEAMPPKIKSAARKRYKVVQISRFDADGKKLKDALIIKARNMTPEERVEEDLRRAQDHDSLTTRRAQQRLADRDAGDEDVDSGGDEGKPSETDAA